MAVIVVLGTPAGTNAETLEAVRRACAKEAAAIKEFHLVEHDVQCFFPADMAASGLEEKMIVTVAGLVTRPEQANELRNRLAGALGVVIEAHFPEAKVEVFTHPFDPAKGYWTNERPPNIHQVNREAQRMLEPVVRQRCLNRHD